MNLWEQVCNEIGARINPHSYSVWFAPARFDHQEGNVVFVRVPTQSHIKRLSETYRELIRAVLRYLGKPDIQLRFIGPE